MKVSIVKCKSYDQEQVDKAVKESLDLIGFEPKPGQKILLKPNLLMAATPDKVIITHNSIIIALTKIFKESEIYLGDSPAGPSVSELFEQVGLKKLASERGIKLINFNSYELVKFENPKNTHIKEIMLPKIIQEMDLIINLPKLKTHTLTKYTGAIKNLYGFVPGAKKAQYHLELPNQKDFSKMIVELYTFIKPGLTIMDGVIGMEGNGPAMGKPKKTGLILASENALALDIVSQQIIGFNPKKVDTTVWALKDNPLSIEKVGFTEAKVLYKKPINFIKPEFVPKFLIKLFFKTKLEINQKNCKKCMDCFNKCPVKAIKKQDNKLNINQPECIKCYCCHEICPHRAIDIKKNKITDFLSKLKKKK